MASRLLPSDISTRSWDFGQANGVHRLLGNPTVDSLGLGITWRNTLSASKLLSLVDHHVSLPITFPAAGYVKIVAEASLLFSRSRMLKEFELDDFFIQNEIHLAREEDLVQVSVELQPTGSHEGHADRTDFINFRIRTRDNGSTTAQLNALGCIRLRTSDIGQLPPSSKANPHTTTPIPLDGPGHIPEISRTEGLSKVENDAGMRDGNENIQRSIIKTGPMSFGQSGFWFMTQLVGDPTFFNGTVSFLITKDNLEFDLLARLVHKMGNRHEGLRTAFFADQQSHQPTQGVLSKSSLHLEAKKIASADQVRAEIDAMNRHVYDITQGETLRLLLLSESLNRHHLILGYHHINIDGMSVIAIVDELSQRYGGTELPPPFQQNVFADRQRERLRTGQYRDDISFWKNEFKDLPEILPILPLSPNTLRSRPTTRETYRHVRAERRLNADITARLQGLRKQGYIQSPFHFYVTIFQILLSRIAQLEDLCIGMASSNRHNDPESTDSVGIFLNLVALRLRSDLSKSFLTLLQESKAKILAGLRHSAVPFDVVLEEVGAVRHPSHSPLFQAFVNYIPVSEKRLFGDGTIENREYEIGETIYDIMLAVIDPPIGTGNPWIAIMVQKELYSEHDAQILLDCFINLMDAFTRDIHLPARTPQMFNEVAVQQAIELGQGPSLDIEFGSLIGQIDDISARNADETALKDTHGALLTYRHMITKSIHIAHALSASGVAPKSRIGVLQEPTVDWICSMLGIWRFGGSYVPLEVTQGVGRLKSIVHDADLSAVLVHDVTRGLCKEIDIVTATVILNIETVRGAYGGASFATTSTLNLYIPRPSDEAIVLYTSGSTGVPKGISLPHRMVTNTIRGFLYSIPMKPQIVLQQIALSFDVSWWQTLLGLVTGGSVVVAGKEARRDPFALTNLIFSQGITLTLAVPSEAMSWLQHGDLQQLRRSAWEWHISAGEEIGGNLVERLRAVEKPDLRFVNAYGPAETIVPHAYEIPYRNPNLPLQIPIGKVMPNYSVYFIDQDGHPLPAGVPGQIVIGGAGVASGYIKQPEVTAARFPRDSLASARAVANGWTHAHLSGDRGYMRDDGVFVVLGRMNNDTQVKLRGQRFDLREVELAMVSAKGAGISAAICHIRRRDEKDASSAFLVAHVVLAPEMQKKYGTSGPVVDRKLRDILSDLALPQYMRPSVVVSLPSMPLNHHGKVDRQFLSKSPLRKQKEEDRPAKPILSQRMAPAADQSTKSQFARLVEQIWRDVLGDIHPGQRLDENSDFFLVGGNSLLLINVKGKIKEQTGHDIPLVKLFEDSTLGKMAATLKGLGHRQLNGKEHETPTKRPHGSSQAKIKQIWLSVLGETTRDQDIGPDSDFFLVGGNSLLLISIQKEVHKEFGILLPLAKLFEASTLAQMSILLDITLAAIQTGDSDTQMDFVNWQEEVAFKPQGMSTVVGSVNPPTHSPADGITVVLTGGTGFLGRHILQRLVNNPTVTAVHCIAVRDASKLKTLSISPKVKIHRGDLSDSRLGLSDDAVRVIFSGISAIIHNGADVSFLRGYRTVRAANVLSTKILVQLAMKHYTRNRPFPHFHFVSTAGITQLGTSELYEESLAVTQPPENSNGYVASKWASEKYLENAQALAGLPVTIHRPTYITGPDAPPLDVMHNILHYSEKLRSVPQMPRVDRWLQFVGIDEVAQDIAADVLEKTRVTMIKVSGVQYCNHCGAEKDWVRLDQLKSYMERQLEGVFSEVAFTHWIDAAGSAGMPTQVREYLRSLVKNDSMSSDKNKNSSWIYPRVLKGPRSISKPWRRAGKL